ncbi:MAG: GatB/YqeY domain-containing protein [Patescibacteria group bacterium]
MLHEQIKSEIKQAMLKKEAVRLGVVRGLSAAFVNELVAKKRKPDEWLTDDEALAVVKRAVKQRQDSIEQFKAGGRADLVEAEMAELAVLKTYLPPELSSEVIEQAVRAKMAELNITDKKDAGKLIGAVMKDLAGKADGAAVKAVIEKLLT